jgi:hypothetical protein
VEHERESPNFPVKESVENELLLVLVRETVVIELKTRYDECFLFRVEELCRVGIVEEHPEANGSDSDCCDTFENEDPEWAQLLNKTEVIRMTGVSLPSPALVTGNSVHFVDQASEKASESASGSSS